MYTRRFNTLRSLRALRFSSLFAEIITRDPKYCGDAVRIGGCYFVTLVKGFPRGSIRGL